MYSKFSDFTQDDLEEARLNVADAQAFLTDRKLAYERAVISAGSGWAKRKKLPLVEEAQKLLNQAIENYDRIQNAIQANQEIAITDGIAGQYLLTDATEETGNQIPWSTIGIGIGALVLVIVILKVL